MNINNILDQFADDVTEIDINHKSIDDVLDFRIPFSLEKVSVPKETRFTKLIELSCNNNEITCLDNLPNSLSKLYCSYNKISSLDNLPDSLIQLDCDEKVKNYDKLMEKYNNS